MNKELEQYSEIKVKNICPVDYINIEDPLIIWVTELSRRPLERAAVFLWFLGISTFVGYLMPNLFS